MFEFVEGVSIGEAADRVSHTDRLQVAREVGGMTRSLHAQHIPAAGPFAPTWDEYRDLLDRQRERCAENHREWGDLPDYLVDQIDDYLAPTECLIDAGRRAHLIHADITADHILGALTPDGWRTTALIDFGDAMVGDHLYELVALHLDVFRGDTGLLAAYLDAYAVDDAFCRALPHRAMSTCLLHRFDVLSTLPGLGHDLAGIESLSHLADALWTLPEGV
ncbi:hypothetical protein CMK11_10740 [Candidatus Poribacteria bacterium]|nr:hypothetical protein [Candidatus Poribacteria bacterium]